MRVIPTSAAVLLNLTTGHLDLDLDDDNVDDDDDDDDVIRKRKKTR